MSWSVTNLIFLLLSGFSRLLLSILISLASLLWNPGVYMYAIKDLITSKALVLTDTNPFIMSKLYFKCNFQSLLSVVLSIAYTASPTSMCPLILFFCQNAQSNVDVWVWGFFSLQSKAILQEPLQHLFTLWSCWAVWSRAVRASQFAGCLWFFAFCWECRGRICPACFLHTWKGWHSIWCSWDSDLLTFLVVSLWCFWNNAQGVWQLCGDSVMQADLKQNRLAVWNSQMVLGNFWDSRNPGKQ